MKTNTRLYSVLNCTVHVSVCRRFVCQRFLIGRCYGISTFWFGLVCRRFGLSTFWSVDVSVCRRFGLLMFITRDSEVIMFSPCVFVCLFVCGCLCLSRCLSGRFNYEGLVPHKQYFAGTLLGMSSCASYVSRTHDVIDDVTRSQSRSNFEIDISPSIFELRRPSKARNVGNAHGYLSGIFNFRYNFR